MDKKQRGYPAELHEYNGKAQTGGQWAAEIGISEHTFRGRLKRFRDGALLWDDVFKVPKDKPALVPKKPDPVPAPVTKGIRTKILAQLFENYNKHLAPQLEEEFINYKATGEIGPAMGFFLKYKEYFPKDKSETLDGEGGANVATVAVVINATAPLPTNITILDP